MITIDILETISNIRDGVDAVMTIHTALAECDHSKTYTNGLFFVTRHLQNDMEALYEQLKDETQGKDKTDSKGGGTK